MSALRVHSVAVADYLSPDWSGLSALYSPKVVPLHPVISKHQGLNSTGFLTHLSLGSRTPLWSPYPSWFSWMTWLLRLQGETPDDRGLSSVSISPSDLQDCGAFPPFFSFPFPPFLVASKKARRAFRYCSPAVLKSAYTQLLVIGPVSTACVLFFVAFSPLLSPPASSLLKGFQREKQKELRTTTRTWWGGWAELEGLRQSGRSFCGTNHQTCVRAARQHTHTHTEMRLTNCAAGKQEF